MWVRGCSDKVARFVVAVAREPGLFAEFARINGGVGVLVRDHEAVRYASMVHVIDGRIQAISLIANPAKLTQINRAFLSQRGG
jgi:hypothetical protein